MIWLSWRQFRAQALVAALFLTGLAAVLIVTGLRLAHLYDTSGLTSCGGAAGCSGLEADFLDRYHQLRLIGTLLIVAPAIIGAFLGAPLISRELESGTNRLAWTQSVTRAGWLRTKIAVVGGAALIISGAFTTLFSWWAGPLDAVAANRLTPAIFDQRGIVPIGYTAFAFLLGVASGLVLRRTLAAMATTLAGFTVVRMAIQYLVRPHLLASIRHVYPTPIYDSANSALASHAWVVSTKVVDAAGHTVSRGDPAGFTGNTLASACHGSPTLDDSFFRHCADRLGLHNIALLQPEHRFWTFQVAETAIFVALAVALALFCFWWISRRA